jgi:O-antigen/teichoic acid export membrane protein
LRALWSYGAPLSMVALASQVLNASDRLLVAGILGPAAAGAYAVASVVADRSVGLLMLCVALASKPMVFAAFERHGADDARRVMETAGAWLMAVGFPACTVLIAAPNAVSRLLVGPAMAADAARVLPWAGAGALISGFVALHFGVAFQISRGTVAMLAALVPAALLNLVANLLLLPRFGVMAAAWTTVGGYAAALALVLWLGRAHFPVPFPARAAARTAAACMPMALVLRLSPPTDGRSAALALAAAAAVYVIAGWLLDVADVRSGPVLRR